MFVWKQNIIEQVRLTCLARAVAIRELPLMINELDYSEKWFSIGFYCTGIQYAGFTDNIIIPGTMCPLIVATLILCECYQKRRRNKMEDGFNTFGNSNRYMIPVHLCQKSQDMLFVRTTVWQRSVLNMGLKITNASAYVY